ncbi:CAP domain-containing protein [Paenibacillus sp. TAB 01]|uniref:CAP domain-containing protein n=1 Tax=Paenibacillus sp. TAB 01 TaxID=3368988 RepID=UPI003752C471
MLGKWKKSKPLAVLLLSLLLLFSLSTSALGFGSDAKGPDVFAVQGMLKSMGYFPGEISGYYGPETVQGVKAFQKAYGLPVTGAVDDKTLQAILWAYGNLKLPKAPAPKEEPAPAPAPNPPPSDNDSSLTPEEQQMVDLVNEARKQEGLQPLAVDPELTKTARLKSQDMVDKNYFSHDSPTYGSPFDMMKQFGISYSTAGENIACNQSVEAAHKALMESPGHRANILSKDFTHIGIGIVNGGSCGKMFTQQFIGK